jgi:hypothetical protein
MSEMKPMGQLATITLLAGRPSPSVTEIQTKSAAWKTECLAFPLGVF